MKIWDLHCHLSGVSGRTPHERMAALVRYADRMRVEKLVVFMGMSWSYDPKPDDFRRENDEVIEAIGGNICRYQRCARCAAGDTTHG